jgi:hypothetical protein
MGYRPAGINVKHREPGRKAAAGSGGRLSGKLSGLRNRAEELSEDMAPGPR